jgi:hypothetical protein
VARSDAGTVKLLLAKGADATVADGKGATPKVLVEKKGTTEIVILSAKG